VIKLDREQLISVSVLGALLISCLIAAAWSLQMRSDALQDLDERRALLSRLEARVKANSDARARSNAVAPAAAFIDAPTQGLAGAQLQAHVMQMAGMHHAVLISSGLEPAKREDAPDSIRLQATLDTGLQGLQSLLYQLESGTPYVFVDSLAIQLPGGTSQRAVEDPLLRITIGLRAFWRRGKA
jgi:general secretion pathway protein M